MLDDWRLVAAGDDRPVDWRLAENLAYGSLLANGFNVRLSGLDVGRGTFVHRHHVWHDQDADTDWQDLHVPLRHIAEGQGIFSIFESPLSEEAVVGFEYGYSLKCGRDLVVWEAQFGDFVNNAQVIIDQYIASGEAKWGYESGLVLLLPHGHDGWGPEHSCAFLGRFLQLCAAGNMHVAMPSTAAQMFHLLRRQALTERRQPLVVMTPKLPAYAHAAVVFAAARARRREFHPLLGEDRDVDREAVRRVIVTSGKLYYDLADERAKTGFAICRYCASSSSTRFRRMRWPTELRRFPQLRHVVWAQEEARNHGAWHLGSRSARDRVAARGVAALRRPGCSAAAATGSAAVHAVEQREIVAAALEHARALTSLRARRWPAEPAAAMRSDQPFRSRRSRAETTDRCARPARSDMNAAGSIGRANRKPCSTSQPCFTRKSACALVSTPSRDGLQVQASGEADRRAHDRGVRVAGHQVGDERAVDFQRIELESLQVAERRVAGAEIVERDRHAQRLELGKGRLAVREIVHQQRLGQFELEACPERSRCRRAPS